MWLTIWPLTIANTNIPDRKLPHWSCRELDDNLSPHFLAHDKVQVTPAIPRSNRDFNNTIS